VNADVGNRLKAPAGDEIDGLRCSRQLRGPTHPAASGSHDSSSVRPSLVRSRADDPRVRHRPRHHRRRRPDRYCPRRLLPARWLQPATMSHLDSAGGGEQDPGWLVEHRSQHHPECTRVAVDWSVGLRPRPQPPTRFRGHRLPKPKCHGRSHRPATHRLPANPRPQHPTRLRGHRLPKPKCHGRSHRPATHRLPANPRPQHPTRLRGHRLPKPKCDEQRARSAARRLPVEQSGLRHLPHARHACS